MTKQEKIQEAYGEYYERIKNHIDYDGWIDTITFSLMRKGLDFDLTKIRRKGTSSSVICNRPKKLQGIENNNGWIKIESEDDFPKEDIECYVTNNIGRIQFGEFEAETQRFFVENNRTFPTHYQRVIKPNYPLY